jgi:HK97 family phage prohead protease
MMDCERKALPFEFKDADEGEPFAFSGYASAFNNIDDTAEIIAPGAFKDTLPRFLSEGIVAWQHDWSVPIGKPLEAREEPKGLYVRARISDTTQGRDAITLMRDGVVKKLSIGFRTTAAEKLSAKQVDAFWSGEGYLPTPDDLRRAEKGARLLRRIDLYEFSPVSVPANREASITALKHLTPADEARMREARRAYAAFQRLRLTYSL